MVLGLIGLGLVISLGLPQVLPELKRGAICTNLPQPRGGNSRSLLAISSIDNGSQDLEIEVEFMNENRNVSDDPIIKLGESIDLRVFFINHDKGPITLYYRDNRNTVGDLDQLLNAVMGLIIEIEPVASDTVAVNEAVRSETRQVTTFALEHLYNLPSHSRCYVEVTLTRDRLNMPPGEYRIRVHYRNGSRGVFIPATPAGSRPTQTPIFDATDIVKQGLGVYVGTSSSNEIRFTFE